MKIILKILVISFSSLLSLPAFSAETGHWHEILNCDNGSMVIDQALTGVSGSHRSYSLQLVIRNGRAKRNDGAVWHFIQNGAYISGRESVNEVVIPDLYRVENSDNFRYSSPLLSFDVYPENQGYRVLASVGRTGQNVDWLFESCRKLQFPY